MLIRACMHTSLRVGGGGCVFKRWVHKVMRKRISKHSRLSVYSQWGVVQIVCS